MIKSFKIGLSEIQEKLGNNSAKSKMLSKRTDRDLSIKYVLGGVSLVVMILAFVPGLLGYTSSLTMRLVAAPAIAIFAFFFVTVSSRIVGLVGVSSNPTSGMTIVTLLGISLLFVFLGWTDEIGKVTALMVGTVVCVAASIAGDTSQDLKTGYIVGATPSKQQIGELIGAATSALAVCAAVMILNESYKFGSEELSAPQATLIKTLLDGVLETGVPWGLILVGVFLGIIIELFRLPSLPFAVGLYLPVSTMTPIFMGGLIKYFVENRFDGREKERRVENGILFSSGLIGGEGMTAVGISLYTFYFGKPIGLGLNWPSPFGEIVAFAIFLTLGYILYRRTKIKQSSAASQ
jgi:putative OPT family oligopeptide transporter